MGGANEICTDKTGTLTQNKMTVQAVYHENKVKEGDHQRDFPMSASQELVTQSVLWNCSAFAQKVDGELTTTGNVTEVGMLNFLLKSGVDI